MTDNELRVRAGRNPSRTTRVLRMIAAVLAVVMLALAAGCGDDGDDGTTSAATPPATPPPTSTTATPPATPPPTTGGSADEYRTAADGICGQQNSQIAALGQPASSEELSPYLDQAITISEGSLQQFSALTPPAELAAGHAEALALLGQQIVIFKQAQAAIAGGTDPQEALQAVTPQLDQVEAQLTTKAQELGLTVCGTEEPGGTTPPATPPATPPSTPPATPPSSTPGSGDEQFQSDIEALNSALTELGTALQAGASDPTSIDRGALENAKNGINSAIQSMGGYTLSDTAEDVKRQTIVGAGPGIVAGIDGIIAAIDSGNAAAVQAAAVALGAALAPIQQVLLG